MRKVQSEFICFILFMKSIDMYYCVLCSKLFFFKFSQAWDSEQRVRAFKIGIQCSKLLSDVNVMQFYPSKFVLITDILDTFGNLVFDRLKGKSFG